MKTFADFSIETDKPWTMFHRHATRKPICKAPQFGPGGINCPCCNDLGKAFKPITRRRERNWLKAELRRETM